MATGRGAKGSPRSTHRGWTADPAPSSATHHHRAAAQRCGPSTRKGTTPPHHSPTVSARPPGTEQLSATGHTQPPRTPVRCTHHHHGSARQSGGGTAGRQGRATDQGRPPGTCHPAPPAPPGTRQLDHRAPCINIQSNGQAAQLRHRFGFWNATMLLTARSSHLFSPHFDLPRPEPARNAQRRRSVCIKEACRG